MVLESKVWGIVFTLTCLFSSPILNAADWHAGTWDSTINNLIDHPKTVALRIEVVDKETREPIPNAMISFEGEYWIAPRTIRDPEGEREAQEMEYKVTCQTDSDGIAVGAFGWQKEYPWGLGVDDVEKAQRIEVRHSRYQYVELATPFGRFLEIGQKKTKPYPTSEDTYQPIPIVQRFEKIWPLECAKRDVKFFVLDLGTNYEDFDKAQSTGPEFFEKVRDRKWSVVFEAPQNMMKWGLGDGRSWCGPYFVYLIEIQMERRSGQIEVVSKKKDVTNSSAVVDTVALSGTSTSATNETARGTLGESKTVRCFSCGYAHQGDITPNFCPECDKRWTQKGGDDQVNDRHIASDDGLNLGHFQEMAKDDPLGVAVEILTPQLASELYGFPELLSVSISTGNLVIRDVFPGSLADNAGLKKNDIFSSVKLPDQGFNSFGMFSSLDDYHKMWNTQVMQDAKLLDVALFQFPQGYRFKDKDVLSLYDYYERVKIRRDTTQNTTSNKHQGDSEPKGLGDQEKDILDDTLKGLAEIPLPSLEEIKSNPAKLFDLMAAFKRAKQDVTIAAIRAIPVKDPDTGQISTFEQFASKAVAGMDLGPAAGFFQDDPIAATYMLVFDKRFLLEEVPLVKTSTGEYVSLMEAARNGIGQGDSSNTLKTAVDGLTTAYAEGKEGAFLFAVKEVVSAVSLMNERETRTSGTPALWDLHPDGKPHYYEIVVGAPVSWQEAKQLAELRIHKGLHGYLASVTSAEEQKFILATMGTSIGRSYTDAAVWLGGYKEQSPSSLAANWQWTTGEKWDYANWDAGEPTNSAHTGGNEYLLEMYWNFPTRKEGKWNDQGDICRRPGILVEYSPSQEEDSMASGGSLELDLGNGITMAFVQVAAGAFNMGSENIERDRESDEGPVRRVQITKSFYLSKYEVTQDQYMAVMGNNPSNFSGMNLPVEQVSWNDAVAFCQKLSGKTGRSYRLPTEAEWEYACRAGAETRFYWGDDTSYSQIGDYAWYTSNSGGRTHAVGQKMPNKWGLHDMLGNVWEWCADRYAGSYQNMPMVDPEGPSSGMSRVLRGGCCYYGARQCRSAFRHRDSPGNRRNHGGFRVALETDVSNTGSAREIGHGLAADYPFDRSANNGT